MAEIESVIPKSTTAGERLSVRDPFRAPMRQSASLTPKSELETYALEQFTVVAVSTGPNRPGAMVSVGGKSYLVQERVKIGPRGGHIRKITPDAIIVREKIVNPYGQEEEIDTPIRFGPDKRSGVQAQVNGR